MSCSFGIIHSGLQFSFSYKFHLSSRQNKCVLPLWYYIFFYIFILNTCIVWYKLPYYTCDKSGRRCLQASPLLVEVRSWWLSGHKGWLNGKHNQHQTHLVTSLVHESGRCCSCQPSQLSEEYPTVGPWNVSVTEK